MSDKASKFIFLTVFVKGGHIIFSSLSIWLFCFKIKMGCYPFKIQSEFHLKLASPSKVKVTENIREP